MLHAQVSCDGVLKPFAVGRMGVQTFEVSHSIQRHSSERPPWTYCRIRTLRLASRHEVLLGFIYARQLRFLRDLGGTKIDIVGILVALVEIHKSDKCDATERGFLEAIASVKVLLLHLFTGDCNC